MDRSRHTHRFTLLAAGLVITGLGLTAGCAAAKESPSPTGSPTTSKVDSNTNVKRPGTGDNSWCVSEPDSGVGAGIADGGRDGGGITGLGVRLGFSRTDDDRDL